MTDQKENRPDDRRSFEENPFSIENRRPEDIVRLFYVHNVPIIPVVSKRGILIGILKKDHVISELSDIGRVEKVKTDEFVTRLARKPDLDELLPYGSIKEFVVINIFGEEQGRWSRLQLFAASETPERSASPGKGAGAQKEEQILEWMIYLILEHIPRALYAVNTAGKTIFYNSHFEEMYRKKFKKDVDHEFVERAIADADANEIMPDRKGGDLTFFNRDLGIHYEKIPLMSKRKKVGFLLFCAREPGEKAGSLIPGVDTRAKSMDDIIGAVERLVLVDLLKDGGDPAAAAKSLRISHKSLLHKIKKYGIKLKK